jgi:DNA-directed RNA polymerase subunit E'/Rpb7
MFYVTTLEHEIVLEPLHFGPKLRATIVRLLKEEVEGLVSANDDVWDLHAAPAGCRGLVPLLLREFYVSDEGLDLCS